MEEKTNNKKREEITILVGPLLKKVLDKQKDIVKETTWECINPSYYDVGEIVAKKIMEKNII